MSLGDFIGEISNFGGWFWRERGRVWDLDLELEPWIKSGMDGEDMIMREHTDCFAVSNLFFFGCVFL